MSKIAPVLILRLQTYSTGDGPSREMDILDHLGEHQPPGSHQSIEKY